ncbi:MAG: hypothetical protein AAFR73_10665 [Pseudomonadota bacterium]
MKDAIDTDGFGFASLAELHVTYPGTASNSMHIFEVNRHCQHARPTGP